MQTEHLPTLTKQQSDFVMLYIKLNNATEAYRIAYESKGSTATCCVEGSRLLKNPKISLWIEHYRKTIQEHIEQEIKYSVDDAFRECDELKIIALESRDKEGRPNVAAANKAVEMKIKLKGLMKDDAAISNQIVMQMSDVEINGVTLKLAIGDDIEVDNNESD